MCGIVGIFDYSRSGKLISSDVINQMSDEIRHRGPDDSGIFVSDTKHVGFGFRRLSIVDLSSAGHQPMATDDGSIWIVFNGEIYNHLEIRLDLESKGYRYKSKTDTETILYAYQEYGADFVTKLIGMFAIAIWDRNIDKLFLIRDRIGIKPVYYTNQQGAFFFSSEIKAILKHPKISTNLNSQGLYDYLSFLITPPSETMFHSIFKLEPGHILTIDNGGNAQKIKYWDLEHQSYTHSIDRYQDEQFCVDNIRELLRDSIRLRMMADVPFGVLLSGGIDSSLNVAIMSEFMNRPVETFSIGYKDLEQYNELTYAHQISDKFATNHHELLLDEQNLIDFLPNMIWHQDEPNADPVCVPMYYASQLARQSGTIVVQVGEGSDEQFAGYRHYLRECRYYKYHSSKIPVVIKNLIYRSLRSIRPNWIMTEYARRASSDDASFYGGAIAFTEELKSYLVTPDFRKISRTSGNVANYYLDSNTSPANTLNTIEYLRKIIYMEFKNRLPELLLMRVDKMSMAASVEARVPFLDHRLVEFAYRIPGSLKVKNGITKYILKKAAEGIIPNDIIYRKKQGFAAPIRQWLRTGKLRKFTRDRIFDSDLMKLNLFRSDFIDTMLRDHQIGKNNFDRELWSLLLVCMWYDAFIARKDH